MMVSLLSYLFPLISSVIFLTCFLAIDLYPDLVSKVSFSVLSHSFYDTYQGPAFTQIFNFFDCAASFFHCFDDNQFEQ